MHPTTTSKFAVRVVADVFQSRHLATFGSRHAACVRVAERSVVSFIDRRVARFPRLASRLIPRFSRDRLPPSTVRAVRRAAVHAVVRYLTPAPLPARRPRTTAPRTVRRYYIPAGGLAVRRTVAQARRAGFETITAMVAAIPEADAVAAKLNRVVDDLVALARKAGEHRSERNACCAAAHVKLFEDWRADQLHRIGRPVAVGVGLQP